MTAEQSNARTGLTPAHPRWHFPEQPELTNHNPQLQASQNRELAFKIATGASILGGLLYLARKSYKGAAISATLAFVSFKFSQGEKVEQDEMKSNPLLPSHFSPSSATSWALLES